MNKLSTENHIHNELMIVDRLIDIGIIFMYLCLQQTNKIYPYNESNFISL